MKKKTIILSIALTILISLLNAESGIKHSELASFFTSVEALGNTDLGEVTVTCSSPDSFYGKCKLIEPFFCANGAMAAHCYITGRTTDYCSATLVILCTLFPLEPHP